MKFGHITICALLGGGLLGLSTVRSVEAPLMEYGTGYRETAKEVVTVVDKYDGVPMLNTLYDVDGDGSFEVSELRIIQYVDRDGNAYSELEPIVYGFDMNEDGLYDNNEAFLDEAMDGLNGNEVKFNDLEKKVVGEEKKWI